MIDIALLLLLAFGFGAATALVRLCERLVAREPPARNGRP
jgi:hypothetical protein